MRSGSRPLGFGRSTVLAESAAKLPRDPPLTARPCFSAPFLLCCWLALLDESSASSRVECLRPLPSDVSVQLLPSLFSHGERKSPIATALEDGVNVPGMSASNQNFHRYGVLFP